MRAPIEPGAIQLMMLGGGSEVPENRLVILRQQREAIGLVLRPRADSLLAAAGRRDGADGSDGI